MSIQNVKELNACLKTKFSIYFSSHAYTKDGNCQKDDEPIEPAGGKFTEVNTARDGVNKILVEIGEFSWWPRSRVQ